MTRTRLLGVLLLAAAILAVVLLQAQPKTPVPIQVSVAAGPARVGAPAPDFSSSSPDGARVRLSRYRGKPVLVNFWATWCGPCQDEMPLIQRARDRWASSGLTVLAVNYRETDARAITSFLKKVGARFPAVYDPDGRIAAAYGVTIGLPITVFIDRAGVVSVIQVGQMSGSVLDAQLTKVLS